MKKKFNFIFIITVCLFLSCSNAMALNYNNCDYSKVSRMKSLVSNVNISYDYYLKNNEAYFNITINNLVPEIYFIDSNTNIKYYYSDSVDGEIVIRDYQTTSGVYKFYSSLSECNNIKLGDKFYKLPSYNNYYEDPLCKENKNFSLCQKWKRVTYSYNELKKLINDYNKEEQDLIEEENKIVYKKNYLDHIVEFYINYYYIILLGIIGVCVAVMIINRKKNKFDL